MHAPLRQNLPLCRAAPYCELTYGCSYPIELVVIQCKKPIDSFYQGLRNALRSDAPPIIPSAANPNTLAPKIYQSLCRSTVPIGTERTIEDWHGGLRLSASGDTIRVEYFENASGGPTIYRRLTCQQLGLWAAPIGSRILSKTRLEDRSHSGRCFTYSHHIQSASGITTTCAVSVIWNRYRYVGLVLQYRSLSSNVLTQHTFFLSLRVE